MEDFLIISEKLKNELDESRYDHTIGVMYTAACLAMRYDMDMEQARLAGLLHDCAKCVSHKKKISICEKENLEISDFERENPFLLHAKAGACLAKKKYGINDQEILDAITWHTTGKPAMSKLEQVVFIADYIEPNRDKAPRLPKLRNLAFQDLDRCTYEIMKDTVTYLNKNPKSMDVTTLRAYEYYEKLVNSKEE